MVLVLVLLTSHALWSLQLERRMQRGDNRGRVGHTPPQGSRADSVVNRRLKTLFDLCAPAPRADTPRDTLRGDVAGATSPTRDGCSRHSRPVSHALEHGGLVGTGYRIPHLTAARGGDRAESVDVSDFHSPSGSIASRFCRLAARSAISFSICTSSRSILASLLSASTSTPPRLPPPPALPRLSSPSAVSSGDWERTMPSSSSASGPCNPRLCLGVSRGQGKSQESESEQRTHTVKRMNVGRGINIASSPRTLHKYRGSTRHMNRPSWRPTS